MEIGDTFRVNLYRGKDKKADKKPINMERQQRILKQMTAEEILREEGERKSRVYRLK